MNIGTLSKKTNTIDRPRCLPVVGGQGTLTGFCRGVALLRYSICVLCRNRSKFKRNFVHASGTAVQPIVTDYCDQPRLEANLTQQCASDGEFDDIIALVHEEHSKNALYVLARFARRRYFAVLECSVEIPSRNSRIESLMRTINPNLHNSYAALVFVRCMPFGTR